MDSWSLIANISYVGRFRATKDELDCIKSFKNVLPDYLSRVILQDNLSAQLFHT